MAGERTIRAFVVGPTGVGKTDVALILASLWGTEIVSIDSRQIYRCLEIGTAKPTPAQRALVPHHLIDLLDPRERCSAGRFVRLFREVCDDLRRRGATGIAVGGAGLYVDACLGRFHPLPPANASIRARYAEIVRLDGYEALHAKLVSIDPETAERLAPRDVQRVTRALEIAEITGRPMSDHLRTAIGGAACPPETPVVHLSRSRADLYARIEARCEAMIDAGLPAEVQALMQAGVPPDAPGMRTVGYAEWVPWVGGNVDCGRAHADFVRNSRRYAKRQETWFRNRHPRRIVIPIGEGDAPERTAEAIARRI